MNVGVGRAVQLSDDASLIAGMDVLGECGAKQAGDALPSLCVCLVSEGELARMSVRLAVERVEQIGKDLCGVYNDFRHECALSDYFQA